MVYHVLVACLITIRKISDSLGSAAITKDLGAMDIIKLDPKDSFLLYTSKNESYV